MIDSASILSVGLNGFEIRFLGLAGSGFAVIGVVSVAAFSAVSGEPAVFAPVESAADALLESAADVLVESATVVFVESAVAVRVKSLVAFAWLSPRSDTGVCALAVYE